MSTVDVERLIRISKENPLLPERFVPWDIPIGPDELYLPLTLVSLEGLPIYDTLTESQKRNLGRHEAVQAMYAYAWSEGLFCLFMNRYVLTLQPDNVEYRFLLRELIEEFRHQEMFAMAIKKLDGTPVKPTRIQNFIGLFTAKYFPADTLFMVSLALELIADQYGEHMRLDPATYVVLQKVSQLHNIEEARHILFTRNLLERYIVKAGFIKKTWYSLAVLMNIHFFQTMYVKREIFKRIGMKNADEVYHQACENYKTIFERTCLSSITEFVRGFGGYNWITKPVWKFVLKYDAV